MAKCRFGHLQKHNMHLPGRGGLGLDDPPCRYRRLVPGGNVDPAPPRAAQRHLLLLHISDAVSGGNITTRPAPLLHHLQKGSAILRLNTLPFRSIWLAGPLSVV
ncbi:hypothetical protein CMUS01_07950 [Colletotrichum musicola]|uniref:Uncharacterized protein n=1 Tax=Colletotrichum musicola TaxID=2175873 RepID=A0A8H6NE26_9PEZI|nr:hypothetical protein CMUS01_07950 [Colletotrichum musicola]